MKFIPSSSAVAASFRSVKTYMVAHKIASAILIVAVLGTVFVGYRSATKAATPTRYVVEMVKTGAVAAVISGSGQVSASNQVSLVSKTSGEITAIRVKAGQHVYKGQVIASVDLGTAGTDLQTAELQLKQAETSNSTSLTSSSESADKAQSDLTSARESALNTLTSSYGTLDQVIVDLNDLYSTFGYLPPNEGDAVLRADQSAGSAAFIDAQTTLKSAEAQTSTVTRSSTNDDVQRALTTAYNAAHSVAKASALAQTAAQYARTQKNTSGSNQTLATQAWSTVSNDVSNSNSQVTALLSASQSITSALNAITDANSHVTDVSSGSGALDIRSAELNVQAKEQAYNDHFVIAPFDGVIAQVSGNVGSQASGSTGIATLIT
ncbi:MAG: family efflux transporter subunit, HlyD family secretion protein, partial [Parcubacteria group bacterium]|nr:family efflux transporter subunit, HlyD family secretion protein [Parcubacteria group bacterium]